jgi:hypothetical protein
MPSSKTTVAFTLPFAKFWTWLNQHPNCILRAGTPEVVLFDDEDVHWHFSTEEDGTMLVQLIRGKKLLGELAIAPQDVTYVQVEPGEGEEVRFDLQGEGDDAGLAPYHFVLSHGYDEEETADGRRFTH